MKVVYALLVTMLIFVNSESVPGYNTMKCEDYEPGLKNAFSLDFCKSTLYDSTEEKCCFLKYELDDKRHYHCYAVKLTVFNDINKVIENIEGEVIKGSDVKSLDCSSSYLFSSLLVLLALFF